MKAEDIEWPEISSRAAQKHLEQQAQYLFDRAVQEAAWRDALSVSPQYVDTAAQQLRIGKRGGAWADPLSGVGGIFLGGSGGILAADYWSDKTFESGPQTAITLAVLAVSVALTVAGYVMKIVAGR